MGSEKECLEELNLQRKELAALRVSKISSAPQVKMARIRCVRKNIAKVLTEMRRTAAKDAFAKSRHTPYDLRTRGTRAFRRRLTRNQKTCMTRRAQIKADDSKLRKYAVQA